VFIYSFLYYSLFSFKTNNKTKQNNNNNYYLAANVAQYTVSNDFNCLPRSNPGTVGAFHYSISTNPGSPISAGFKAW